MKEKDYFYHTDETPLICKRSLVNNTTWSEIQPADTTFSINNRNGNFVNRSEQTPFYKKSGGVKIEILKYKF